MSVTTLHPALTTIRQAEWDLMRDCMDGEGAIKAKGGTYLPKPSGFNSLSDGGAAAYRAYKDRAQFPELLAPSVGAMIGIIHGNAIDVELPPQMEYLYENADGDGLPLDAFHRRITRDLLVIGAYCVLSDAPSEGGDPYLVGLSRDLLINWDHDWFVLDETRRIRDGFVWKQIKEYRLLQIDGGQYLAHLYDAEENYQEITIRSRGGGVLERIPFVVGNAMDLSPNIEAPPLIGVANAARAIYQLSADYRHQLYMSGQETLVAINGPKPTVVGAGVVHEMMGGADGQTPDLKYVSPSCSGIEAHAKAMQEQREAAVMAGARLFEKTAAGAESGEAKRLRYASETATLETIAMSSCLILERALKNAAMIMGAPEDAVVVTPPKDLMDHTMSPQDFAALFGVYRDGGMSWETYFANGQKGGIFSEEMTAEEEQRLLDGIPADGGAVA